MVMEVYMRKDHTTGNAPMTQLGSLEASFMCYNVLLQRTNVWILSSEDLSAFFISLLFSQGGW